jgi:sugar O-acyltransferase (sialic acid O-acetyltransferase NeuD family)
MQGDDWDNGGAVCATRKLVIVGAGGFGAIAASTVDDINATTRFRWDLIGYADSDAAKRATQVSGRIVHGTMEDVDREFCGHELWFFCAIGDNTARDNMVRLAEKLGWQPATLIHPTAVLARPVEIGRGSYIGPAAVVSVNAKLGAYSFIDMHASVGHDAVIQDFCAVFPGARVTGCCRVGKSAVIGSNATLLPGTIVGDRAVVGAASLGHGSIASDTTVLGVPAQVIHRRTNSLGKQ